ncbi:hypothetical protein [Cryobacterium sp. M91]|uniref:hypothetical protein n=1 Tax=Cryobacterium sp. M91 TaxID=2048294 RepID=UPI0011B0B903|nr:hypothetical protein [Cryobacterium sp. M91]
MPSQYSAEDLVVARMKELVDLRTSWNRSLWQVGSIVALGEIVESVSATWSGQLTSPEAMKDFITGHKRQINLDHGLGSQDVRTRLLTLMESLPVKLAPDPRNPTADGRASLAQIAELLERGRSGYLLRWASHINSRGVRTQDVEVIARLVVSHLLDEGFNRSHIHGWLTNLPTGQSLAETVERGDAMLFQPKREFELLIAIRTLPSTVADAVEPMSLPPQEFLDAFKLTTNSAFEKAPRLPATAIRLTFTTRDPHSAISEATTWIRKFSDRVAVGTGGAEAIFEHLIVDRTTNKVRSFKDERQLVRVPSMQRNALFGSISVDSNSTD